LDVQTIEALTEALLAACFAGITRASAASVAMKMRAEGASER
jgi:predicted protein tyrosine phosphatase